MPKEKKSVQDQTAAETKSIGFDYQYYYFLYKMIQMKTGQTLGYEVKDDVHIDKENGDLILIQLKHSLDEKANITEKDSDLWKTISNWIKIINDDTQGRSNITDQLTYITKTTFLLVTNKSSTTTNTFLKHINEFRNGCKKLIELKEHLEKVGTPSKGNKPSLVDGFIALLLQQEDSWLEAFLKKVNFLFNKDSLIDAIKLKIKEKNVQDSRINDVYDSIDSNLRTLIYDTVKSGQKITINFDLFHRKFTKFFELGRSKSLPIRSRIPDGPMLPSNPLDYTSIKQLIDAEILDDSDDDFIDELIKIFTDKLLMHNNEERWLQDSEITTDEISEFNKLAIKKWKNKFDGVHITLKKELRKKGMEKINKDQLNELASKCYFSVLDLNLTLDETNLETELSNGKFYLLSDHPAIGWVYDWQERYVKS